MQKRWWAIVTIGLSIFMVTVDMSIVSLGLPAIANSFHQPPAAMSIVTLSYTIALTVMLIPAGQITSRFRPQYAFIVAVLGFALASVFCGLAQNLVMLIIGRVIQGAFGALITTMGTALAAAAVPMTERGRAMGTIGTIAPLGAVAGPSIGGFLLSIWGWSSIFFVNVPVSVITVLLALWLLGDITFGVTGPRQNGWRYMGALLQRPQFICAIACMFSLNIVGGALYFILPFDLSLIQHFPSALSGATLLFMPLGLVIMAPIGGYFTDRYGAKPMLFVGIGFVLVGLLLQAMIIGHATFTFDIDWRLLMIGLGFGLFAGPLQTLIMSIGPRQTLGAASALSNLARNLGMSFGPLVVSVIWTIVFGVAMEMVVAIIAMCVFALISLGLAWMTTHQPAQESSQEMLPAQDAMK